MMTWGTGANLPELIGQFAPVLTMSLASPTPQKGNP